MWFPLLNCIPVAFSFLGMLKKCHREEGLLYFKFMFIVKLMSRGHLINASLEITKKEWLDKDFLVACLRTEDIVLPIIYNLHDNSIVSNLMPWSGLRHALFLS